ncbi:hypothetical protein P7K49_028519 [Saguinus oedipus]|uniref:Uncharacterized protein n=1 Tax=Saguinus oedipus TaxID=9490 RepID=A0ABQ9U4P2_SAGOE|nr:hypothetical protein P7K49_028519 [Saguinus oedipus]
MCAVSPLLGAEAEREQSVSSSTVSRSPVPSLHSLGARRDQHSICAACSSWTTKRIVSQEARAWPQAGPSLHTCCSQQPLSTEVILHRGAGVRQSSAASTRVPHPLFPELPRCPSHRQPLIPPIIQNVIVVWPIGHLHGLVSPHWGRPVSLGPAPSSQPGSLGSQLMSEERHDTRWKCVACAKVCGSQ